MIYAHAILTGYTSLRGSPIIHPSMFFAMLFFVDIPDNIDESFAGGDIWYWYALFMHFILSILTFSSFIKGIEAFETVEGSSQMVAVLAQILNFTTMLTIFANAPICYD